MQKLVGRTLALAGAALALASSAAQAQQLPPARQIVDRYMEAIGGRQALSQQRFRTVEAEMSMPAMGMSMNMVTRAARPNKFVMRMSMPGMGEVSAGYDGQTAWSMNPATGPQILQGKELNQALRQADFEGAMDLARAFPTMETTERATVDGKSCYRVRMVSAQSDTVNACFDVDTGLMSEMAMRQASSMGEVPVTMKMTDYRDFGGLKMPARTTMNMAGQEMVTTIKSVRFDAIPETEFVPPAEIKAMTQKSN